MSKKKLKKQIDFNRNLIEIVLASNVDISLKTDIIMFIAEKQNELCSKLNNEI